LVFYREGRYKMKDVKKRSLLKSVAAIIKSSILLPLAQNDWWWKVIGQYIVKAGQFTQYHRQIKEKAPERAMIDSEVFKISPDLTVKYGVFKGMKLLPGEESGSGSLIPKLLGAYEYELRPVLEKICHEHYTEIINVGCAEGYYAVGFAMRFPDAKVFAYDIDKGALKLCEEMARLNKVSQQ
jgi:hypothetical protein